MLWRTSYEPRVLRDAEAPSGEGLLLGAFDVRAQSEIGVWTRLFDEAGLDYRIRLFRDEWTEKERRTVDAVFPPSVRARIELATERGWAETVAPDRPERTFAALIQEGRAKMLVIGPPTEEVWEEFSRLALST